MTDQTLSDIRVLDLSWYIAGPFCTKLLADFGADIIKVERPLTGDPTRSTEPFLNDDPDPEKSLLFSNLNLNKRSITLDLKSASGQETVKELVREADILVESFSPGVLKRQGLDYEVLKTINPNLSMTSLSNFGQTGPDRDFKASERVLSGLWADMYSCGLPGRYPLKLGGNCLQYLVGHMAAVATIAAYWFRLNTGLGQYLDLSMQQVLAADTNHKMTNLVSFAYSGMALTTMALGRIDPRSFATAIHPTGVYPCLDGYVRAYSGLTHWERFLELFPQFEGFNYPEDVLDVENNKPEVDVVWYEWCAERTRQETMETCQSGKYWVTAINTPRDFISDPQMKARGFWVEVDHPVTGKQIYPGDPLHAESSPWRVRRPAPLLGQHTQELLDHLAKNAHQATTIPEKSNQPNIESSDQPMMPLQGLRVVDMGA